MPKNDILYHYTSIEAFLKIVDCNIPDKICLRATHARFFNDPHEYNFSVSLLKKSLHRYVKMNSLDPQKSKNITKKTLTNMGQILGNPYILSFSENPDDLSMWRTYGANGKGIAIGFDKNDLIAYAEKRENKNTKLYKCVYNENQMLKKLIDYWDVYYKKIHLNSDGSGLSIDSFNFFLYLIDFSFKAKKNDYQAEKEWRLCKNEVEENNVHFYERNGLIIPFIEHYFPIDFIKKIFIGPSVNKKLTKESIYTFHRVMNLKLHPKQIKISNVPYQTL